MRAIALLTALAGLFSVFAAHAAATEAPKRARWSFERSCDDVRVERARITARCRDLKGRALRAALLRPARCVGDIWNYEGKLYCSDSVPPTGQYLNYCKNPYTENGDLYATCLWLNYPADALNPRAIVEIKKIADFRRFCRDGIWWWNGRPTCDHPPKIDRVAYAQQCAARMGPIGPIDCAAGAVMPVTIGGTAQSASTPPKDGVQQCDAPAVLSLNSVVNKNQSQCVPGSTFRVLPKNPQFPNVVAVAQCRKYADGPLFQDVAVIQHRSDTGETCFFQSFVQKWGKDGNPFGVGAKEIPDPLVQTPDPKNPGRDLYWTEIVEGTYDDAQFGQWHGLGADGSAYNCVACHDSNPFVWTPYLSKVAIGIDQWNPLGNYNPFVGGLFGAGYLSVEPVDPATKSENKCVACHRIGIRSWPNLKSLYKQHTGKDFAHNMPPGIPDPSQGEPDGAVTPHPPMDQATLEAWQTYYGASIAQLDKCVTGTASDPFPYLTHKAECRPVYYVPKKAK